jgi:hypothetical protein
MIGALLLLLQAVVPPVLVPTVPTTQVASTLPPQDWSTLPILRSRCARAVRTSLGWTLTVDLAVLITPDGRLRRVTPRAIDCPTVEQYAAGVILGSRDSIDVVVKDTDTWYRTTITFAWGA